MVVKMGAFGDGNGYICLKGDVSVAWNAKEMGDSLLVNNVHILFLRIEIILHHKDE